MFVDDVLGGGDSVKEAQEKFEQVDGLLAAGGFKLQKWTSNEETVLSSIEDHRKINVTKLLDEEPVPTCRALGLSWDPHSDAFLFKLHQDSVIAVEGSTKRSVLSLSAKLFDPIGWLAPITITAKFFLQKLWRTTLGWDDPLPQSLFDEWRKFAENLARTEAISIPRWLGTDAASSVQLHGFSDASQDAVAAVVYLRVMEPDFTARCSIVMAKTKVAPLKKTTIARLELSAAALLSQLVVRCRNILEMQDVATHLWSDSSVALTWIAGQPSRWKEYVANRVQLIHDLVPNARWHHVPGVENPADIASRRSSPEQLLQNSNWWKGPDWLAEHSTSWPKVDLQLPAGVSLEERPPVVSSVVQKIATWRLAERYASLNRLLRVTAYVQRAATLFRRPGGGSFPKVLDPEELETALLFWVRHIQAVYFPEEIEILRRGEGLPRSNALIRLTPFFDKEGLVRVGGRLNNADVEYDFKHPYILPRSSPLSNLLINDAHMRTLHGGVQLTLSTLRQKFWIIGGRAPVRSLIQRCVRCARQRGKTASQMMGQLPKLRTTPSRPFLHSGVDYAGPYTMRTWRGRGAKTYKAYIIIFVCFATSAIHLELASDYSTEGFLSAYKRFAGRRGVCATIPSDCGSNLVGADTELKKLFDKSSEEFANLRKVLAADRTKWIFNPPSAPHFGGKWEAGVKSTKFHLKRVVGEAHLTYEEFSCLLTQIEGVLNSRPLCPLSEDPNDFSALTPGHFLVGGPINTVPEPSLSHLPESRLSRWRKVRQMTESFWNRWSKEYLQRMQAISKWHHPSNALFEGSLVLIVDERYPPSKWPLARVTKLHSGKDGLVRVATVRTADGEYKRPVVKLCILPVPVETDQNAEETVC